MMRFALLGGDKRSVFLSELLRQDGHEVKCFALEKAVSCEASPEECVRTASCVILGVPAIKNGTVNAPLSDIKLPFDKLLSVLTPSRTLCGGFGNYAVRTDAAVFDLLKSESFACGNAALTAEGALALLIESSGGALCGSEILVLGAGRVAKALVQRLGSFEAAVTVGARSDASLERALSTLSRFDYIVNTVPARIVTEEALKRAKSGAVILELASAPGGFDGEYARKAGLTVIAAPGLPGRFSPRASAELMKKEILKFMEAEHEQ